MDWLFTWTWQGTLVAAGAAGVLRLSRRLDAAGRCRIWWTALLAISALGLLSWLEIGLRRPVTRTGDGSVPPTPGSSRIGVSVGTATKAETLLEGLHSPTAREWPEMRGLPAAATALPNGDAPPPGAAGIWKGTSEAGARIGAGARRAARATSGLFTRFATSVAGSF